MLNWKKLAAFALLFTLLAPVQARTRKGDKLMSQGRTAELQKQYDQALDFYEQALSEDPGDSSYQLAMRRVRFQAGQAHVERGLKLRTSGKLDEALAEFEKAYAIDPASSIADQEIRRTRSIIEREKKKALSPEGESKMEERGLTSAELARKDRRLRPCRGPSVSAISLMRASTRCCARVCGRGLYSPFDTICVGTGERNAAVSAGAVWSSSAGLR